MRLPVCRQVGVKDELAIHFTVITDKIFGELLVSNEDTLINQLSFFSGFRLGYVVGT